MKSELFDMLMDLIDGFFKEQNRLPEVEQLVASLAEAGVDSSVIQRLVEKIEDESAGDMGESGYANEDILPTANSFRIYSEDEVQRLSADGRALLVELETAGLIDRQLHESILCYALDYSDAECIDLDMMKWLILAVVTRNNPQTIATWIEFLLYPERFNTQLH